MRPADCSPAGFPAVGGHGWPSLPLPCRGLALCPAIVVRLRSGLSGGRVWAGCSPTRENLGKGATRWTAAGSIMAVRTPAFELVSTLRYVAATACRRSVAAARAWLGERRARRAPPAAGAVRVLDWRARLHESGQGFVSLASPSAPDFAAKLRPDPREGFRARLRLGPAAFVGSA